MPVTNILEIFAEASDPTSEGSPGVSPAGPRVVDLHFDSTVKATCKVCAHEAELKSSLLRQSLPYVLLTMPLREFADMIHCAECNSRGVWLNADHAPEVTPSELGVDLTIFD